MKTIDIVKQTELWSWRTETYDISETWIRLGPVFSADLSPDLSLIEFREGGDEPYFAEMTKEQFGEFIQHLQELHSKMKA